jgi:DNA end-binding protein Ku
MREREYLVAIFAEGGLLRAQALRFPEQVRSPDTLELPSARDVPSAEVERFVQAIRKRARRAPDLDSLHDEHAFALRELAEKKARSNQDVVHAPIEEEASQSGEIVDLMEVLRRSLSEHGPQQATGRARRKSGA